MRKKGGKNKEKWRNKAKKGKIRKKKKEKGEIRTKKEK